MTLAFMETEGLVESYWASEFNWREYNYGLFRARLYKATDKAFQ